MLPALDLVQSRRMWFVPGLLVWGQIGLGDVDYLAAENFDGDNTILFGYSPLGEPDQSIAFADLVDHRGNHLPAALDAARVIPRPRSGGQVYIVGDETPAGFRIARTGDTTEPVTVDLLIIELRE